MCFRILEEDEFVEICCLRRLGISCGFIKYFNFKLDLILCWLETGLVNDADGAGICPSLLSFIRCRRVQSSMSDFFCSSVIMLFSLKYFSMDLKALSFSCLRHSRSWESFSIRFSFCRSMCSNKVRAWWLLLFFMFCATCDGFRTYTHDKGRSPIFRFILWAPACADWALNAVFLYLLLFFSDNENFWLRLRFAVFWTLQ